MLVEEFHQLDGEHEQLLGYQHGGAAVFQRGHDLFQTGIEIQGSLVAETGVFVKPQHIAQMLDVVDNTAVAGHNALGHAGGAGGKHDVNGVDIQLPVTDGGQSAVIYGAGGHFLVAVDGATPGKALGHGTGGLVADHYALLQCAEDQLNAVAGHFLVKGHIVAAAVHRTQKGRNGPGLLFHKYNHGLAAAADAVQKRADGPGLVGHLAEGKALFAVGKGGFVGHTGNGLLQIFQNISLHGSNLLTE